MTFKSLRPPLLTCEAVLAEAWHLLSRAPPAREALAALHDRRIIRTAFDFEVEADSVWRLTAKYADVPMDFADACLVRMAELHPGYRIWTLDSDFVIYRLRSQEPMQLLTPA